MTDTIVSSGVTSDGIVLTSGDTITVNSGGTATNTYVSAGGRAYIYGHGTGTTLSGLGANTAVETVYSGGVASGDTLLNRSFQYVLSGGTASNTIVSRGAYQVVSSGASVDGTTINSAGFQLVYSGATVHGTIINSGAQQVGPILAGSTGLGGVAVDTILNAGTQLVASSGSAVHTTINGGVQTVNATGSATNTVINGGSQSLQGGYASGTTIVLGGQYVEAGAVASDTVVTSVGYIRVDSGGTLYNATVASGYMEVYGAAGAIGTISGTHVSGTTIDFYAYGSSYGTVLNSGSQEHVSSGAVVDHTTAYTGNTEVVMVGGSALNTVLSGGRIVINSSGGSAAVISGLEVHSGGSIDVNFVAYNSGQTVSVTSGGLLTVTSGGSTVYSLQLSGNYTGDYFHTSQDTDGTLILTEDNTPCYCPGTLIATDKGEVLVEDLVIGDRVINHKGEARAIKWIGHRSFSGRFIATKRDILPICFKAGSIGENVPRRDLWVSPHHAMYLNGVLIEAKDLVNGLSIYQASSVESVKYFHVELDSHDVIIAEGALAESFVDDNDRGMFHNAQDYVALYPETEATNFPRYYAPRIDSGEEVEAARASLDARSETYFGAALKSVA